METLAGDVELCRAAHEALGRAVSELDDQQVGRATLLPGWTVGHLLTHIARNADSVVRRLDGARRGVVVDQYPGGPAGRAAEIEAGATRPARAIVADVVATAAEVDAAFTAFPEDRWGGLARTVHGDERPVSELPFGRLREVQVHLVDLGMGHRPADWPPELAERWLPELLPRLPRRTDPTALLAWALRRGPAPELAPF
jgi:maleylpyruvate isomerase